MVFTMESNDFHVLRFSGQGQKIRDSGQKFDAKNQANSGQKFLENPMPKIMEFHQKSVTFHENLHFSQENSKICCIVRNFLLFCTAPLPRSTFRRRRGTSRTAPEEHGAATGRPKPLGNTPGASTACTFSKNHFFTQKALPERPGSLPKAPADAHGTALEPPRVARGAPRARFSPKIVPKWSKMHEK